MYNLSQVVNGLSLYVDNELVAKMNGAQKWIFGTFAGIYLNKSTNVFNSLKNNPLIKQMELINDSDEIDIDLIYRELLKQAENAITFDVPMIGPLTLNKSDVEKLYSYIKS